MAFATTTGLWRVRRFKFQTTLLETRLRDLAASSARGSLRSFRPLQSESAGNAGCPMHPQPRVRWGSEVCTRVFKAEAPETSGIPARNGFNSRVGVWRGGL